EPLDGEARVHRNGGKTSFACEEQALAVRSETRVRFRRGRIDSRSEVARGLPVPVLPKARVKIAAWIGKSAREGDLGASERHEDEEARIRPHAGLPPRSRRGARLAE